MRKTVLGLVFVVAAGTTVTSCKKGENDPFISLKSRKSRISGEWKLIAGEVIQTNTSASTSVSKTTLTETTLTTTDAFGDVDESSIGSYDLTIEKDGTYSLTIETTTSRFNGIAIPADSQETKRTEETGVWIFGGKNKDQDLKSKEAIILNTMTFKSTSTTGAGTISSSNNETGWDDGIIWKIDMLKNKEVVFKGEYSYTDYNGDTMSIKYSYTYESN